MKVRSASAASTPTSERSFSSAGDTIEVAQKSSDDRGVSVAVAEAEAGESGLLPTKGGQGHVEMALLRKDADDMEMEDADDPVTEYDFTNDRDSAYDDDEDENPGGIFTDLDHEIIEISSDDGMPHNSFALDLRPWRHMTEAQRAQYEKMYCEQLDRPIEGDWQGSENYQEMQDMEMEEYIKDIKLQDWVIGVRHAQRAWDQMIARKRMRGFGVPVYQEEILRQLGIQPQPPPQPPPGPPQQHRNQAPRPHRQPSMPHHPASQPMPPPPPPPHHGIPAGGPQGPPAGPPPNIVYQPMQQVGVDQNGQPVYQPVHPPLPQPGPNQPHPQMMPPPPGPPKRKSSHPQAPHRYSEPVSVEEQSSKRRKRESHHSRNSEGMPPVMAPSGPAHLPLHPTQNQPIGPFSAAKKNLRPPYYGAEPNFFPWDRDINFDAAKVNASWNDKIYTPATLNAMEGVRERNAAKVARIDAEDAAKWHQSKLSRGPGQEKPKRQKRVTEALEASESGSPAPSDLQTSGQFGYATEADQFKARALMRSPADSTLSVEALMQAADAGGIDVDLLNGIMICWRPQKKGGLTQTLQPEQVVFSVRDSILTRIQLAQTPVLTDRAAECLIDFCPDTLWRDVLLRITSETSMGPLRVRDRMCKNGNFVDKSAITKRIGAALGKKQSGAKVDMEAAAAAYEQNKAEYIEYQVLFGKASVARNTVARQSGKSKRDGTEDVYTSGESRPTSRGSDGSVVEVKGGNAERMTTRSSLSKGKGRAKLVQLDGADDDYEEAVVSRPSTSGSDGSGVVVGERGMKTRSLSSSKGKGKAKVVLDDDEDDDEEEAGVVVSGACMDSDEVSLQSDGELDRLVEDSD